MNSYSYYYINPASPLSPLNPLHPANPIQHMETPAKTPVPEEVYDANDMLIGIFGVLIIGFILGRLL